MADEALTNAAVEWVQRMHEFVNAADHPPTGRAMLMTDDFTYEDRRSGGMNFGQIDASEAGSYMDSMWNVGSGRPHMSMPEVVAIHGDRLAAVVEVIDYGNDSYIEATLCYRLDPGLRLLQRVVVLDRSEVESAIAELERMSGELDD